jgi:two-component system response regulator
MNGTTGSLEGTANGGCPGRKARDPGQQRGTPIGGEGVLLVEDDEDQAILAVRALREQGIVSTKEEVLVVSDGEEALERLLGSGVAGGRLPKLVLLDLDLPGKSGYEVLKRLREDERTQLLPVVLFSFNDEPEQVLEGYRLGANSFVPKPLQYERFSETLGVIGRYWLWTNRGP